MENKHIDSQTLKKFHSHQLGESASLALLEHVSQCTYCAALFAESFHDEMLVAPPRNLKEQILIEVSRTKPLSPKSQLFFYSLRVCAGMCGALFLLFTSFWNKPVLSYPIEKPSVSFDFLENVNTSLSDFTFQINETMNSFVTNQTTITGGNYND
ncbi:MAG: hypothetical protein RSB37_03410 [Acetivibrio sp.]